METYSIYILSSFTQHTLKFMCCVYQYLLFVADYPLLYAHTLMLIHSVTDGHSDCFLVFDY